MVPSVAGKYRDSFLISCCARSCGAVDLHDVREVARDELQLAHMPVDAELPRVFRVEHEADDDALRHPRAPSTPDSTNRTRGSPPRQDQQRSERRADDPDAHPKAQSEARLRAARLLEAVANAHDPHRRAGLGRPGAAEHGVDPAQQRGGGVEDEARAAHVEQAGGVPAVARQRLLHRPARVLDQQQLAGARRACGREPSSAAAAASFGPRRDRRLGDPRRARNQAARPPPTAVDVTPRSLCPPRARSPQQRRYGEGLRRSIP